MFFFFICLFILFRTKDGHKPSLSPNYHSDTIITRMKVGWRPDREFWPGVAIFWTAMDHPSGPYFATIASIIPTVYVVNDVHTVMMLPCYCCANVMLLWYYCHATCYCPATTTLLSCYWCATAMLLSYYCHATALLLPCYCHAITMLLLCYCHCHTKYYHTTKPTKNFLRPLAAVDCSRSAWCPALPHPWRQVCHGSTAR